jgi:hypothetical protein
VVGIKSEFSGVSALTSKKATYTGKEGAEEFRELESMEAG